MFDGARVRQFVASLIAVLVGTAPLAAMMIWGSSHIPAGAVEARSLYRQAQELFSEGDTQTARTTCQRAIQLHGQSSDALILMGTIKGRQGDLQGSIQDLQRALQIHPNHAKAHQRRAWVQQRLGNHQEAIVHYRQALRGSSNQADVHNGLGQALAAQELDKQAAQHLQEAIDLNPGLGDAHYYLGNMLQKLGRPEKSVVHWQRAMELRPHWVAPLLALGQVRGTHPKPELRNAQQAIELLHKAAELSNHQNPQVLATLSEAYAANGQFQDAIQAGEQALQLARASGNDGLMQTIQHRLDRHRQGTVVEPTTPQL